MGILKAKGQRQKEVDKAESRVSQKKTCGLGLGGI